MGTNIYWHAKTNGFVVIDLNVRVFCFCVFTHSAVDRCLPALFRLSRPSLFSALLTLSLCHSLFPTPAERSHVRPCLCGRALLQFRDQFSTRAYSQPHTRTHERTPLAVFQQTNCVRVVVVAGPSRERRKKIYRFSDIINNAVNSAGR